MLFLIHTWITMWGYNVCPLRIGGSRVITTNVWGLFDCKAHSCIMLVIGQKVTSCTARSTLQYVRYRSKRNSTFGKRKRRTMLLYWILKSLACPWSRRNDWWSSTLYRPLHIQRFISYSCNPERTDFCFSQDKELSSTLV
jgi:hypothetical protein